MSVSVSRSDPVNGAGEFRIRRAGPSDYGELVRLFDASIAWMTAEGLAAQWGSRPFSADPVRVDRCRTWAANGQFYLCEHAGAPVAALVLGDAPDSVPPSAEREVFVLVLVGSREPRAKGSGALLLQFAEQEAVRQGAGRVRLDCFAGNDGRLVSYYQDRGYRPTDTFFVGDWQGRVLEHRVGPPHPAD